MSLYKVNHGEEVIPTGKTRNLGHGWQIEVTYTDGSTGYEHFQDVEGYDSPMFNFIAGDDEKEDCWDCAITDNLYESLADAVDHYLVIKAES